MKALRYTSSFRPRAVAGLRTTLSPTPWTCQRCLSSRPTTISRLRPSSSSPFSTTTTRRIPNTSHQTREKGTKLPKRTRLIIGLVTSAGVLGALGYKWGDVVHAAKSIRRAGKVAGMLAVCINDYRVTLNKCEEHPEQKDELLSACHQRCADRTYKVLEWGGSLYIKLGQHLAAMGYLLPPEWTTTFIPLQDKCPVSSYESIQAMIFHDTGSTIEELFLEFDPKPIGAASLAQVHRARLRKTGEEVAVKLQHPALAEWIPLDLALTRFTFRNIKWFFPEYPLEWLSDEVEASLPEELNFTKEAANIYRVSQHFSKLSLPLVVPKVIWAKPRILVMSFLPGHRLDDLDYLAKNNISRDDVSASLAHIFNEMVFGHNAPLHCDPHGGNIAIRALPQKPGKFEIVLYDHGLYRDIPTPLRRAYAHLWLAVLDADEARMRKYAREVAGVDDDRFHLFASAITGRDYTVLASKATTKARDEDEQKVLSSALASGDMLAQLMQLLAGVPRVILLILKTNDLTRSLDEGLKTSAGGAERTFLILARYCARTVLEEELDAIRRLTNTWERIFRTLGAYISFYRVEVKLGVFEIWVKVTRRLGFGGVSDERLKVIEAVKEKLEKRVEGTKKGKEERRGREIVKVLRQPSGKGKEGKEEGFLEELMAEKMAV